MTDAAAKAREGCGSEGLPLVTASGQRFLCLTSVEAAGDAADVDPEARAMLRWLTNVAETESN